MRKVNEMPTYIVDIGSSIAGRTIEVEADNALEALEMVKKKLDENKLEKVIQIRDSQDHFFYDYENGFYVNY